MLLAIDPGVDTGWALFVDGVLAACGLGAPPRTESRVESLAIEVPRIYPHGRTASPQSIVELAVTAGILIGRLEVRYPGLRIQRFHPRQWKGSVPKEIHHARMRERLAGPEQEVVARATLPLAEGKKHNVLDAVGIGLFALERR